MASTDTPKTSRLHYVLWATQVLLALMFGMAGMMKATQPFPDLIAQLQWPADVPVPLVRFIGVAEFLGAVGLILPAGLRIVPVLTPAAAAGLTAIMVLAAPFHLISGHGVGPAVGNVVLGCIAGFVVWGRLSHSPISPRSSS